MDQQRIEEDVAHLLRSVEDLSEIVARQADEIDLLTRRVHMLMERAAAQEMEQSGGVVLGDERPPHY